jgi:hypothetical protein
MIGFFPIFGGILVATFVPAYLALYLVPRLGASNIKYIAAAGIGLTFWFFFDTMGDATALGENNGLYPLSLFGGLPHLGLIFAFILGLAALATFDHIAMPTPSPPQGEGTGRSTAVYFIIPAAIALVMGIHGLGEGWDASSAVVAAPVNSSDPLTALLQAFGTYAAVASYPMHKFLEASIIASAYACYVALTGGVVKTKWWHVPLLGLLFAGPSVTGAGLGYFFTVDTSYFYAFGVTSALYAAVRLAAPLVSDFKVGVNAPSYLGPKVFAAMGLGFFLLYTAALLH